MADQSRNGTYPMLILTRLRILTTQVFFYKRLADRTRYQTIYNITFGLLAATWAVIFFHIIFKCFPPSRMWDLDHAEREHHTLTMRNIG